MKATARRPPPWRLLLAALAALATTPATAEGRFGWRGLPPVSVGQTLKEAEAALGAPLLAPAGKADAGSCQRRSAAALPGVVFVVNDGVVSRIETRDARYSTVSGVRVGDDIRKARKTYGTWLTAVPHVYFERGLRMGLYSPDRRFALIMESNDSGRIITLRAGLVPAVELLEGCSK
jgi:hypothetical protein